LFYSRNNIYSLGTGNPASSAVIHSHGPGGDGPPGSTIGLFSAGWQTDLDHDGFITADATNTRTRPFSWDGIRHLTIDSWRAQVGEEVEPNGKVLTHAIWDGEFQLTPEVPLTLGPGVNGAVGAGVSIPNLADWHGDNPDLGAYQRDAEMIPHGPRISELDLELSQRTDPWTKH
jgi:hypothetical protein